MAVSSTKNHHPIGVVNERVIKTILAYKKKTKETNHPALSKVREALL